MTTITEATPIKRWHMIAGASIGNALEFYDFIIYGYFAPYIAAAFFPGQDQTIKLLLTFGTFGVSFLARPVGALVLGALADRRGRTVCMILAVSLMTLGSAMITLMPDRATIGILAPLGILAARLIQGFALGGEFGSSTALMIEHSPGGESHAASWQGTSQNIAGLVGSGIALILSLAMPAAAFHDFGFRIAFAIGTLAGPVAILLRRRLREAPAFIEQREKGHDPDEAAPGSFADLFDRLPADLRRHATAYEGGQGAGRGGVAVCVHAGAGALAVMDRAAVRPDASQPGDDHLLHRHDGGGVSGVHGAGCLAGTGDAVLDPVILHRDRHVL
jgi:MFS family permease